MQDGQVFKDYIEIVCSDTDMLEVVTEIFLGILRFELFTNYNILVTWFAVQIIANNSGYYLIMNREQGRKLLNIFKGEIQDIEIKEMFSSMLINAAKSKICVKS